jgi:putative tryptophan/tyrosine transport system substrate-binding protein
MTLSRRQFVRGAGTAGLALLGGCAQWPSASPPAQAIRRVAFIIGGTVASDATYIEAFRQQLREYGWDLDQQVIIEYRYAEGRPDRLPAYATELVSLPVDIIVTGGILATHAARNATSVDSTVVSQATRRTIRRAQGSRK